MSSLKKNGTIIAVIAIAIIALIFISTQSATKISERLVVIDYDANGKIIQQQTVSLSQSSRSGLPPSEWAADENYIERILPSIPADSVTREFKLVIENTGNVPLDLEIRDGGIHGDYFTIFKK